jgi:hypothetical protein
MTGKQDTIEPPRMPLAQRLSGLIPRRSSSKKPPGTADPRSDKGPGVFRMKRQRGQMPPPRTAQEFKPLEVDVAMLEAFRLTDGWLDRQNEPVKPKQQQVAPQQQPAEPDNSSTPIADLFSNKSVFNFPLTDAPPSRAESPRRSGSVRRPYSMIEAPSPAFIGAAADPASTSEAATSYSILDRGRPVEPKDLVRKTHEAAAAAEKAATAAAAAAKDAQSKSTRYGSLGTASKTPSVSAQISQTENFKTGTRHSMYAGVPPPNPLATSRTWTGQQPVQAPRSVSATPIDRIQTWQRSVTSNSMSAPLAPGPARRMSTRGNTSNRLAWIKELEEKKSNSVGRDIGVLKKQVGSVSDKLAMFESKDRSAAPAPRFPPTRSNSTTSRLSSGNLESVTSAYGNTTTATPRTSIDTVRSSQRASSVMNYYDDSFREKMESIVSGFEADKDKPTIQKLQRVTTQFVSIKPKNLPEEPQSSQPAPGPSSTEPEKVEEPQAESADKVEEEAQPAQPEEAPASTESEEKVEEEAQPAQPEEIVSAPESAEKVEEEMSAPIETAEKSEEEVPAPAEQAEKVNEEPEAAQPEAGSSTVESAAEVKAEAAPANTEEEAQPSQPEAGSSAIVSEKGEEEL